MNSSELVDVAVVDVAVVSLTLIVVVDHDDEVSDVEEDVVVVVM